LLNPRSGLKNSRGQKLFGKCESSWKFPKSNEPKISWKFSPKKQKKK
jgi:hypothetical protein